MRRSYAIEKAKEFIHQFSVTVLITLVSVAVQAATPQGDEIIRYNTIHHPTIARNGMVVSQRALASEVGRDIKGQYSKLRGLVVSTKPADADD